MSAMKTEQIVRERYTEGARSRQDALCCPTDYDARYLDAIPDEVLERDYGCGDPSRYLRSGEKVLDLGSGTGKVCFIAAQVVGSEGRVIGVDMTPEMLEVARRNAPTVAERIGFANVEFRRGRIQDLRRTAPPIEDESVDVVISNCVLNLVDLADRRRMFREIARVLRPNGRAVISDIVAQREVPEAMRRAPELWSGCISGAFTEPGFREAFEQAGFQKILVRSRQEKPWRTVEGIEFRSLTLEAFKGETVEGSGDPAPACCEPDSCC